jgi:TusA-related sulfurtransferase
MTDSDAQPAVGYRVLRALVACDFGALASCLDEHIRFRALLPSGLREVDGAGAAASCFREWFGAADRLELLDGDVEPVAQRVHLSWRLKVHEPRRRRLIEQHAFATVRDDRIVALDLVCSGFQPEEPLSDLLPAQPVAARSADLVLQGDEANCATLTPLVKAALRELASGQVLEVVTSDPSAEADIASWSRLTGNPLLGARTEGAHRHFYVSKK